MALTEEKLKYYIGCEFLHPVMTLHSMDQIQFIIPADQFHFASEIIFWIIEEMADFRKQEQVTNQQAIHLGEFAEVQFDARLPLEQRISTAAHKLSDEMCWISEQNFFYFIFSQFVRGTLEIFEQLAGDSSYTEVEKPDFKAFIEILEKKTPSDAAAKVKVEALGWELVELWRQEIDEAVAAYSYEQK